MQLLLSAVCASRAHAVTDEHLLSGIRQLCACHEIRQQATRFLSLPVRISRRRARWGKEEFSIFGILSDAPCKEFELSGTLLVNEEIEANRLLQKFPCAGDC